MQVNVFDIEKDEFVFSFNQNNIALTVGQQLYFNDVFYAITNVTYAIKPNRVGVNEVDVLEVEVMEVAEWH